ncbi:hypothetical protein QJS10_CPA08g01501 [Acorus calamus]|uniref:S-adenosyl-L-methionine-dependent methyltransferase superfamily protein n=1 Tax=Acorus calamus TaxID=4465 RepID=A0AAV9ED07_ACOCL|nr:hypothetical protein QJS10_CPA08g01501 [Acorus calamus]
MGKKQRGKHPPQRPQKHRFPHQDSSDDALPSSAYSLPSKSEEEEEEVDEEGPPLNDDRSIASPKGDISYLQKFFLTYVGGRFPLHFQEDFCGTALLSTEWLRSDPRRTAIGFDLDVEALNWCIENNLNKVVSDGYSRFSLFHGNVLRPSEAHLVKYKPEITLENLTLNDNNAGSNNSNDQECPISSVDTKEGILKRECSYPARDIVCAFNYSCCCLQSRKDLVVYFRHALDVLSKRGGIFVMDLYGGVSSERKLRLQRRFPGFLYFWEQEDFDIVNRTTRISLHFNIGKNRTIRHAFSYNWRLWSLPEIKECLEEAGFQSVHFWIRVMPDTDTEGDSRNTERYYASEDVKYEEHTFFQQADAWNAYIVGVANVS